MSVFVHAQGIKTVHAGGGGSKNGKILSTLLLNDLKGALVVGSQKTTHIACKRNLSLAISNIFFKLALVELASNIFSF